MWAVPWGICPHGLVPALSFPGPEPAGVGAIPPHLAPTALALVNSQGLVVDRTKPGGPWSHPRYVLNLASEDSAPRAHSPAALGCARPSGLGASRRFARPAAHSCLLGKVLLSIRSHSKARPSPSGCLLVALAGTGCVPSQEDGADWAQAWRARLAGRSHISPASARKGAAFSPVPQG